MLANSEFLIMLNQAATRPEELARLLNISDNQLSYITNVDSGRGLIKCGSASCLSWTASPATPGYTR